MLGTIRLPQNLKLLKSNLPESNYDTDRKKLDIKQDLALIPEEADDFVVV